MRYYVVYDIEGMGTGYRAGPYGPSEVDAQQRDIAGYEGVKNVRLVSETPVDLNPSEDRRDLRAKLR